MTIEDYEKQGGFREELGICRQIGQSITRLEDYMAARPGRLIEGDRVRQLKHALEQVRSEISRLRNGEGA